MRAGARAVVPLLLLCAAAASPPSDTPEYLQAVEFPYYRCPRPAWERELGALKNIGVRAVEFSIPWNWHQTTDGQFDFTGATNPRRDLAGLIRILRRLGLHAWVRPSPPVENWPSGGVPENATESGRQAWATALSELLATQTASHGGPITWVEQTDTDVHLALDAGPPPGHVSRVSATDPAAMPLSRAAMVRGSALLWTSVVDTIAPAGWSTSPAESFRAGAAGFPGEQHEGGDALRRSAALLRNWAAILPDLRPADVPKPITGSFPDGIKVVELISEAASAVSITNSGSQEFHGDLRVAEPSTRHPVTIPGVVVPAGQSLWLPVEVSLSPTPLCPECTSFSKTDRILYATAELLSIDYENGTLGLEFAAPVAASAVLQLTREPAGPYLAAGILKPFEFDPKTLRARLPIPAGSQPGNRVHVVLGVEAPQTSAFFNDAKRLIIGQKNLLSTEYSSADVAARSRLRIPDGYTARAISKDDTRIDYEVTVPADGVGGDTVSFGLEADGALLGRANLQLLPPVSLRFQDAITARIGAHELRPDPAVVIVDPKAGTNLDLTVRNNWPAIRTYKLDASGSGLEFFPPKTEVVIGPADERHVSLRVFAAEGATDTAGLRDWKIRATGAADLEMPMRAILLPRGRTIIWNADLVGDGFPQWVVESQHIRAVFSPEDGGRWVELIWKDTGANFLNEAGAFAAAGRTEARANGDALELTGPGWTRTIRVAGSTITIEQTTPLLSSGPEASQQGNVTLTVEHPSDRKAVYTLK
ncbi:MAG TPA: beta-galactosidase [Verrucomicrobiae bacterium]|nr:beta-galactosidase [Verrucomicrobiae bacterium]